MRSHFPSFAVDTYRYSHLPQDCPRFTLPLAARNVGNHPLAYYRQPRTICHPMAKRRRQIQPRSGPERAFGQAMREIREGVHMSQMDLHKKSGLDRTFISDLERGIQCPSLRTILRVAKALDMAPWNLIRRTVVSSLFTFPTSDEH